MIGVPGCVLFRRSVQSGKQARMGRVLPQAGTGTAVRKAAKHKDRWPGVQKAALAVCRAVSAQISDE